MGRQGGKSKKEKETMELRNRDISWLDFNRRVLLEAANPDVPLYERLKFMAIFSANLDEFFRVRVSALRYFKRLPKEMRKGWFPGKPRKELANVLTAVREQQELLGRIFKGQLVPGLSQRGIHLIVDYRDMSRGQSFAASHFFEKEVRPHLYPHFLYEEANLPFLENRGIYFVLQFEFAQQALGLVNIPSDVLPRFVALPAARGAKMAVIFLDEIVRMHLDRMFDLPVQAAFSIKISRDAELYIDEEYSGDIVQKVQDGLARRTAGIPTRLLYDPGMPELLLLKLKKGYGLKKPDLIPGGRHHNFQDFFSFPTPEDSRGLFDPSLPPLRHPSLWKPSRFEAIRARDQLLHLPYQSFDCVLDFLDEAVQDPDVTRIAITIYRRASASNLLPLLCQAALKGKQVFAFVEVKARFDEAANIAAAQQMEKSGVAVQYSIPGLKVHAKTLLVERREGGMVQRYAYLSTGNFNEKTARTYADHALFTADARLTSDISAFFDFLQTQHGPPPPLQYLSAAPWHARERFAQWVGEEIRIARSGKKAGIFLKMNSLEDPELIRLLYRAQAAGVKVRLIVRGICCLLSDAESASPSPQAISIIDRFLEHARVFVFENDGDPRVFLSSADWMERNMDRRIELIFPVLDVRCKTEILEILDLQWRDNTKSHLLSPEGRWISDSEIPYRAQMDIYDYLKEWRL
ncbi:MAG: polyphosphate kinase 1 [Saprospiraceae bacterium]